MRTRRLQRTIALKLASIKRFAGLLSWSGGTFAATQIIRLGSNVVLSRLLTPELFGISALLTITIMVAEIMSDIGLKQAIVRSPRGESEDFYNTAWTLQVVRGLALWMLFIPVGMIMAYHYERSDLSVLVPAAGLAVVFGGLSSTSLATIRRRLMLREKFFIEVGAALIAAAVMFIWALISPTIWSLVAGSLSAALATLVLSHALGARLNLRNRFRWEPEAGRELLHFGGWMLLASGALIVSTFFDRYYLSSVEGFTLVGLYAIGRFPAEFVRQVIGQLFDQIFMPLVSRQHNDPKSVGPRTVRLYRLALLIVGAAGTVMVVAFGDLFVRILYDERYHDAGWMAALSGIGIWFSLLSSAGETTLIAIGLPRISSYAGWTRLSLQLALLPLGYQQWGVEGVIIALAISELGRYAVISVSIRGYGYSFLRQDVALSLVLAGAVVGLSALRYALGYGTSLDAILFI